MRTSIAEERPLSIPFRDGCLLASLASPVAPTGVVLIAADAGDSRQCEARRGFARAIRSAGFATLMVDLVGADEEMPESLRIDVDELAGRLHVAREWLRSRPGLGALPLSIVGLGGAGAAALDEAAAEPRGLSALVVDCRWPDRCGRVLEAVRRPVLFIAEQGDVVALHRISAACDRLEAQHGLASVPGPRSRRTAEERALASGRVAASWLAAHASTTPLGLQNPPSPRAQRRGAR